MNDMIPSPRGGSNYTGGVMAGMARELALVRNMYEMARDNRRDVGECIEQTVAAFSELRTAEVAQYQYAKGGQAILGPSIHAAQTLATIWGNIEHGWHELSRGTDEQGRRYSEVQAFAVDMQTRVPSRITFIVMHWRDTRSGGYPIKEEREIYELCANMAQRRKRACILALIPQHVIDIATDTAAKTLAQKIDTGPEALQKMVEAFAQYGVTKAHIEKKIQRNLDAITRPQMLTLKRAYVSLRDGDAEAKDLFDMAVVEDPATTTSAANEEQPKTATEKAKDAIRARAKGKGAQTPDTAPADAQDAKKADEAPPGTQASEPYEVDTPERREARGPTAEQLRERLMRAPDKDAAMLVVDAARHLQKPDYDSLVELLEQRYPE